MYIFSYFDHLSFLWTNSLDHEDADVVPTLFVVYKETLLIFHT